MNMFAYIYIYIYIYMHTFAYIYIYIYIISESILHSELSNNHLSGALLLSTLILHFLWLLTTADVSLINHDFYFTDKVIFFSVLLKSQPGTLLKLAMWPSA